MLISFYSGFTIPWHCLVCTGVTWRIVLSMALFSVQWILNDGWGECSRVNQRVTQMLESLSGTYYLIASILRHFTGSTNALHLPFLSSLLPGHCELTNMSSVGMLGFVRKWIDLPVPHIWAGSCWRGGLTWCCHFALGRAAELFGLVTLLVH